MNQKHNGLTSRSREIRPSILIIGKLPPPIGGVRVHVHRLIAKLEARGLAFDFYDLSKKSPLGLLRRLSQYPLVHLHTSSPWLQLILAAVCRLMGTRTIVTYHGNLGRFDRLRNLVTNFSILLTHQPIVLNQESWEKAHVWNKKTLMMKAYIPASAPLVLPQKLDLSVLKYKNGHAYTFCTNASTLSTDKNGREIYGVSDLIDHFSTNPKACLMISDPSGDYERMYRKKYFQLPENVLLISEPHDFEAILHYADAFIRNTTTDGMSISIDEALVAGKTVFATNCVSRQSGCILYSDLKDIDFIEMLSTQEVCQELLPHSDVATALAQIYTSFLTSRQPVYPSWP